MQPSFSPSINLLRDAYHEFDYIPTANAKRIYDQILNDYKIGIHAFNIIGSYGTGKSAFLLALAKTFTGTRPYFAMPNGHFSGAKQFEFLTFVGVYASIIETFTTHFGVATEQQVFTALEKQHQQMSAANGCLVIVIDEFGKFLEYAAHTNPERELYFVQQLAEFANAPDKNMLMLTTLHQGFFSYAQGLTQTQREEWEKVKGRLKELTFNEPVEQLLELAATHIEQLPEQQHPKGLDALVSVVQESAAFTHRSKLSKDFAQRLYPFDLLAASVITQALQRYGQNERSLFTFLNSTDYLGINRYDQTQHPYYNLVCSYDYLIHNFYSLLSTVHNPHYTQWGAIRSAIERVEAIFEKRVVDALKLVKVIGLLNIFAPDGARINENFLIPYAELALGMSDVNTLLAELEARKIVRYVQFKATFVLFEGTDLNIELAILEAANSIDAIYNVVPYLRRYFDFPLLFAKAASYKWGTPRFFEFRLSEEPIHALPEGVTDGFVNLVFSDKVDLTTLQSISTDNNPATLYGLVRHSGRIKIILFEIEKINHVLNLHRDDRVAVKELEKLKTYQIEELNRYTLNSLYSNDKGVVWVWDGKIIELGSISAFNAWLSHVCEQVYPQTPVFRNELANRHKLSAAINSARSIFFTALVNRWQEEDMGFPNDKYPPEKTIYFTLLKQTGIHRYVDDEYILDEPTAPSFQALWQECQGFLARAKATPKHLSQLVETLLAKPFKLKQGLLEFWLPTFLFIQRESFALYYEGRYVPELSPENLELIRREPNKFQVKTFSVEGIKLKFFNRYRTLLQQKASERITNTGFVETIKPFMLFYSSLPEYSQRTQRLDQATLRLRAAIAEAKDPEKTFFEDFPVALNYADIIEHEDTADERLEMYVDQLRTSMRELQNCFDLLLDRVESHLLNTLGFENTVFPDYKSSIVLRYTSLRTHLLRPKQKTLYTRLTSALEERSAWLESIVQTVLGKNMRQMRDEDEFIVYDKLSEAIQELDNLCKLSELQVNPEKEGPVVSIEITSMAQGSQKMLHRLPKQKEDDVQVLVDKLRKHLTDDKHVNVSALTKLLQEVIGYE